MKRLFLEVTLKKVISGYWDGGFKDTFTLELITDIQKDAKGYYQKVDCFQANYWFHIGAGKVKPQTDKQILMNAYRKMFKGKEVLSLCWR